MRWTYLAGHYSTNPHAFHLREQNKKGKRGEKERKEGGRRKGEGGKEGGKSERREGKVKERDGTIKEILHHRTKSNHTQLFFSEA